MCGRFAIDLFSLLPFDVLSLALDSPKIQRLKVVRLVRLLRLLKLMRVLKASRMFTRYEAQMSVSYAKLAIARELVAIVIMCHWVACLWGLVAGLQEGQHTWLDQAGLDKAMHCRADSSTELADEECERAISGPFDKYAISLYFSVLTLTSLGYGDISAQNETEYFCSAAIIAFVALFWAHTVRPES